MPRTLPWLAQAANKPETSSSSPIPKRKRAPKPDSDDDLVNSDLDSIVPAKPQRPKQKLKTGARSPSTSPPAAPPDADYMREGYAADDIWMMVEDEFHSTAQAFTQHIHHAEYVRLKKLAKSRGDDTLRGVTRPTDGRTAQNNGTKLRLEAEQKARQIKNGLKGMGADAEDESEEEDEYMFDPQLAGLMTGSQRTTQDLTGLAKARSNTRAAAGFTKSPQKARSRYRKSDAGNGQGSSSKKEGSESEDEDDLDGPSQSRQAAEPHPSASRLAQRSKSDREALAEKAANQSAASGFFKRFTASDESKQRRATSDPQPSRTSTNTTKPTSSASKPATSEAETNDDVSPEMPIAQSQAALDYMAKRKARLAAQQRSKATDEPAKPKRTGAVPTFAI